MANKLVERYQEIEGEVQNLRQAATGQGTIAGIQERLNDLEAQQADLKKMLLHLIALSKLRDDAWRTLSYRARA